MHFCAKLGADFTIGHPEGYGINPEAVALGEKFAAESGSSISQLNDPREAVSGSQVIYTDTWVSMGQDEEAAGRKEVFPPLPGESIPPGRSRERRYCAALSASPSW